MFYVIDRFEEDFAILVDDTLQTLQIPRHMLPPESRESDCLRQEAEIWLIDTEETVRRKEALNARLHNLFGRRRRRHERDS